MNIRKIFRKNAHEYGALIALVLLVVIMMPLMFLLLLTMQIY